VGAWGAISKVRSRIPMLILFFGALIASGQSRPSGLSPEIQSHLAAAQKAQAQQDYATAETEYRAVVQLDPKFAEAYMNLGLVHQLQSRDSDAMKDFHAALQLKPTLTGANFFLGVDYCKQNNGAAAIPYLKAAVAQQPQQVDMLSWLATAQDLSGQWTAEAETLNRALKVQPQNVNLLYLLGQAYERLGKQQAAALKTSASDSVRAEQLVAESYSSTNEWPSAVIHFQNAIAKTPNFPGLHVELGEVYLHAGKLKAAAAEFENELSAKPNSLRARVRRGEVRLLEDNTSEALKDWQRALELDPLQVQRILGIRETGFGDASFEQLPSSLATRLASVEDELKDDNSPAAELVRSFVRLHTGNPVPPIEIRVAKTKSCAASEIAKLLQEERYSQLPSCISQILTPQTPSARKIEVAGALVEAGEYQSSLRVLDSLPASQKQTAGASYWRARCYEKLATAAYLRLYQADPNSFRVHQLAGDLAATRNDDGKAIDEYRAAVNLNGNAPNLHYSLGHILWKILKIPEARVELEAELKINPHHAGALHDLGDSYLQEHQPEQGLPYLQQAVAADPQNPDIHRDLGTAYTQLKEFSKAVPEYKIGLSNDQDGSVHYKLAKVYQALGQKENADHEFAIYTTMNRESHEKLEKRGQRLADIERTAE
jgi:tetratricopeptide (TPR) repeat protein